MHQSDDGKDMTGKTILDEDDGGDIRPMGKTDRCKITILLKILFPSTV